MDIDFAEQFKDELPHLWRFALQLSASQDTAEELVQQTILRGLEKQHQYTKDTKLRSWLFTILHSIWKNDIRAQYIRNNVSFDTINHDDHVSHEDSMESSQLLREVMEQINSLPEAQRVVIILICAEGYSYQEASDILDVPVGTIMSRLARGRLKIGDAFTERKSKHLPLVGNLLPGETL